MLVLFKQIANGTIDWEVLKQILSKYLGIVKFFYIFILLSDFLFDFIKLCNFIFLLFKVILLNILLKKMIDEDWALEIGTNSNTQ